MKNFKLLLCCTAVIITVFTAISVAAKPTETYIYGGETVTNTLKAQKTDK